MGCRSMAHILYKYNVRVAVAILYQLPTHKTTKSGEHLFLSLISNVFMKMSFLPFIAQTQRLYHVKSLWVCSHKPNSNLFLYSSNHSGNNGSSGSLPSSAGPSLNSEDINNGDHLLNNNTVDNGIAEVCDVPDDVANQKRHVSNKFMSFQQT